MAVFVHGCFWHRCPIHGVRLPKTHSAFWKRKFLRNVERDKLNRRELELIGWKVIEVWEHEVRQNPRAVARKIMLVLNPPKPMRSIAERKLDPTNAGRHH